MKTKYEVSLMRFIPNIGWGVVGDSEYFTRVKNARRHMKALATWIEDDSDYKCPGSKRRIEEHTGDKWFLYYEDGKGICMRKITV